MQLNIMQQHTRCYATRMPNTITNQSTVLHRAFAFAPQQQKRAHRPHKFSSVVVRASAAADPEDARGAIALGLKLFESGDYESALQLFDKSLGLPGTGIKRFRDKPPMISDGEKQAAYFNIACCQSKLGNIKDGLIAVAGCIEAGYTDFRQLRTDPDLEELRKDPKFEGLLGRFEKKNSGFGRLFEGFL